MRGKSVRDARINKSVQQFETVHAQILRFFPDLIAELGGDSIALASEVGIESGEAAASPTYRQVASLLELSAQTLECPDFGMRLALRQRDGDMFGPLGKAMRHSPTFGHALEFVSAHSHAHSSAAQLWLRRFPAVRHVFMGHDILLDGLANKSQAIEQILLIGHLTAMNLTDGRARARRVHFRHLPLSPLKTYRRYFGCPVHFGQNEDGVSFSDLDLACPIVDHYAGTLAAVTAFISQEFARDHTPLHARVRGVLMQQLWTGTCSHERAARALAMHPRTLHRRLTAEKTSFQKIKDEVRRDVMLYYLQKTGVPFSTISEKLGYSEQSVMSRSCSLWFATSPTQIRALAQRPPPAE
jgi:AraC-like DNA-binding protein